MYRILLIIHIVTGTTALISGAIALLTRKGSRVHMTGGKFYWISMYAVGFTSIAMSLIKFNSFLLLIGVFASYMTYSGKVAIEFWRLKENYTPVLRDRLPFYIALTAGILMVTIPVIQMFASGKSFVPILSVFGLIMLLNALRDVKTFSPGRVFIPKNRNWLIQHIGMMSGAYISTVTAFLVVNVSLTPFWLTWLLPSAVGTPLIFIAINKWKKKLRIT